MKLPWTINIHLIKKKKGRRENKSFPGVGTSGKGRAQGKGNEDDYGGCISYPYMKIEE
jgi:hypothetical protein